MRLVMGCVCNLVAAASTSYSPTTGGRWNALLHTPRHRHPHRHGDVGDVGGDSGGEYAEKEKEGLKAS